MTHSISQIHDIKTYVAAAGVLVAFLFDRNLGPSNDDLPMKFKIILAAPVIVGVYYAATLTPGERQQSLPFMFGILIISILVYMSIWSLFSYRKTISITKPSWKPWGAPYKYRDLRVMGGILRPDAKQEISRNGISAQDYFEGVAYNQDLVWSRPSRWRLQSILVVS